MRLLRWLIRWLRAEITDYTEVSLPLYLREITHDTSRLPTKR